MPRTWKPTTFLASSALGALALGASLAFVGQPAPADAAPASAVAGPPWISIEYPVNPFDRSTRGAYLLVHAYYHGTPINYPVSGTAEGVVNGERRSTTLSFEPTSRAGVYALRKQGPSQGSWTLVIAVTQGENDRSGVAQALVELSPTGSVASVHVPTEQHREGAFPRRLTTAEIEAAVRAQAQRVALAGRAKN